MASIRFHAKIMYVRPFHRPCKPEVAHWITCSTCAATCVALIRGGSAYVTWAVWSLETCCSVLIMCL